MYEVEVVAKRTGTQFISTTFFCAFTLSNCSFIFLYVYILELDAEQSGMVPNIGLPFLLQRSVFFLLI